MSFEDSLKALAESNTALAKSNIAIAKSNEELVGSMANYAKVMDNYAKVISQCFVASGGAVTNNTSAAESAEPGKKVTAAEKKAAEAAAKKADTKPAVDDFGDPIQDDFGDEVVPDKLDGDMVKAKLLEVRDAYGDKAPALKIIAEFGYNAIPDVKPADYEKVYKAAAKAIAAAPKK